MSTMTEIANMSYAHLGKGTFIADIEEKSAEAALARLFQKTALKATLRDFHWPFAKKIATAQKIADRPNSEWGFSYRYPTDCLDMRRILSGTRVDTNDSYVPYEIAGDEKGRVILTDRAFAEIEYTFSVENAGLFPPDFELAYSLRWAVYLAPKTLGGDPTKQGEKVMGLYRAEIGRAQVNAAMENKRDPAPTNSFASSRG